MALIIDFSATPIFGYTPQTITFTDHSAVTDSNGIMYWLWDFGDGGTSAVNDTTHTYTAPGSYDVSLTVTQIDGTISTHTKPGFVGIESGMGVLLPELLLPPSIPPFLASGHNVQFVDVYGNVSWSTGEDSKRLLYTSAPRVVNVSLDLNADQMSQFYTWYEVACGIGTEWFSCQLANFGPGLLWFKSRFYTPYIATPDENGTRWGVKFNLYVLGEGQQDPPDFTSCVSSRSLLLEGRGDPYIDQHFKSIHRLSMTTMYYGFASSRIIDLN